MGRTLLIWEISRMIHQRDGTKTNTILVWIMRIILLAKWILTSTGTATETLKGMSIWRTTISISSAAQNLTTREGPRETLRTETIKTLSALRTIRTSRANTRISWRKLIAKFIKMHRFLDFFSASQNWSTEKSNLAQLMRLFQMLILGFHAKATHLDTRCANRLSRKSMSTSMQSTRKSWKCRF